MINLCVLVLALIGPVPSHADGPQAKLRVDKAHYIAGEPIGMEVLIRNPGPRPIKVVTHYPSDPSLDLESLDGPALKKRASRTSAHSGPPDVRVIASGESWTLTLYWPSSCVPPQPGKYRIRASCEVECRDAESGKDMSVDATGQVEFVVEPRDPEALARIYDRELKRASGIDAEDPWPSATAAAALDSVRDPLVIPWLIRMLDGEMLDDGYRAIDKFRDREEARLALAKLVRSGDQHKATWALRRLADWGHILPVEDVRPFLASPHPWPRSQALRYLRLVYHRRFLALRAEVTRLAESGDAADAMPALAVLGGWDVPGGAVVPARLARAVARLDAAKEDEVRSVLDAAAAWRYDIGRERLAALAATPELASRNEATVKRYVQAIRSANDKRERP